MLKTIQPSPVRSRPSALRIAVALIAFASVAVGGATPLDGSPVTPSEGVWISLGEDAWEALLGGAEFSYSGEPLVAIERRGGAVLTRVHGRDLAAISALMHRALHRCAGFMRHPTLEDGRRALARQAEPLSRGVPSYTIDQASTVLALEAALQKPNILETIERLSTDYNNRYHLHPSGTAASQWIRDQWLGHAAGRPDVTAELVNHPGINQPSVVLTIAGATLPDEVVVLGGHLDSTSFNSGPQSNPNFVAPGADDNASGIAVLGEVIRAAMEIGFVPERTVSFMGYAAEEIGLVGSQDIAEQYAAAGTDVVAVLQLDMTDYNGSTPDVGLLSDHTNATLTSFVADLIDTYQPELSWASTACGYACSDHASWNAEGYPAAMPFEALVGEHNPQIHTLTDDLATVGNSVDHAYKFARLAAAFLAETAKAAPVDIFADGFESGDVSAWTAALLGPSSRSSELAVQSANANTGTFAARLSVSRECTDGDYAVPDGPLSADPAVAPCGELTAGDVDVVSGDVRFKAGAAIHLGDGFSVDSAASFSAEQGDTVLGASYVRDESPAATKQYTALFYLDPDGLALSADTQQFDHLVAYDGQGAREFLVGVAYNSSLGENRLFVTGFENDGTPRTTKGACELALGSGWQLVEVSWWASSGTDGDVEVSIDGGATQSLVSCLSLAGGLANGGGEISAVEWGAKSVAGASLGSVDMDDFESTGRP